MNKFTCLMTLLAVSSAFAQDVPPPPKPAADSPNLEVTMKYIQDRLSGQGKIRYQFVMTYIGESARVNAENGLSNADNMTTSEAVLNAVADAVSCNLSYSVTNDTLLSDKKHTSRSEQFVKLSFRDVDRLVVEPFQDYEHRMTALALSAAGITPVTTTEYFPAIFVVRLVLTRGKTVQARLRSNDLNDVVTERELPDVKEAVVPFQEEEDAQRMARAMVHAVELCGGGKDDKDLFK